MKSLAEKISGQFYKEWCSKNSNVECAGTAVSSWIKKAIEKELDCGMPYPEIEKLGSQNKGFCFERTKQDNPREKAFSDHWRKENIKQIGFNYGQGTLQDLFFYHVGIHEPPKRVLNINNRDRFIVARVIQWLGSNCGWCFLQESLMKCGYHITKIKTDK